MQCHSHSECGRLNYCNEGYCAHIDIFHTNEPSIIIPLCLFSIFVGFCSAGNFGSGAIQVFFLMIWMNYSRLETTGISQPILAGICLGSVLRARGKQHPLRNSPLVDYQLSAVLLPPLLGAYLGGLYLRYYIPVFFISLFLCIQLCLLMVKTLMKIKSISQIEKAHSEVKFAVAKLEKTESNNSNQASMASSDIAEEFSVIDMHYDHEEVHIDYDKFFKQIALSKHKEIYIQKLPIEIRKMSYLDEKSGEMVKVQDMLEKKDEDYKNKQITDYQDTNKEMLIHRITVKDVYAYPPPHVEIALMLSLILLNALNFIMQGGRKLDSIVGVELCSKSFWVFFWFQIFGNYILFVPIFTIQKIRHRREYKKAMAQVHQAQEKEDANFKLITDTHEESAKLANQNQNPRLGRPRSDFPYSRKSFLIIVSVGTLGGFLIGFIGLGSSLLMVFALQKLRLNMQSLLGTLPMIIVFICVLGSLLQIGSGVLKWEIGLFYFSLSLFGSVIFVPIFIYYFNKLKMTTIVIKLALAFQLILLVAYLAQWIPQAKDDISQQFQVGNRVIC